MLLHPGDGNLARRAALFRRDLFYPLDQFQVVLEGAWLESWLVSPKVVFRDVIKRLKLASLRVRLAVPDERGRAFLYQKAAPKRRVSYNGNAVFDTGLCNAILQNIR